MSCYGINFYQAFHRLKNSAISLCNRNTDIHDLPKMCTKFQETMKNTNLFQIGGLTKVIVLDCHEEYMRRHMEPGQEKQLESFRMASLPMLGYLDDLNKVIVVN